MKKKRPKRIRYDSHTEPQIVKIPNQANRSETKPINRSAAEKPKPILNKNDEIVYSKFDFTADKTLKKKAANKKPNLSKAATTTPATTASVKPKDYKVLLKKLKQKREQIDELKKIEPEKATELEMKEKWRSVIDKAAGVKVRDDPELLAKSIKRLEKKKEKSRKSWEERVKGVEARKQHLQEKRKKNLDKRKEKNKEKKLKRLKKKGRVIMGF